MRSKYLISTILCCLPFGIVAIIKANSVDSLYAMKQYDAAIMASNEAKKWSYIGMLVSILVWVGYVVVWGIIMGGGLFFLNNMS